MQKDLARFAVLSKKWVRFLVTVKKIGTIKRPKSPKTC